MSSASFLADIPPLTPINFWQLSVRCHKLLARKSLRNMTPELLKKYELPNTAGLCSEEDFARLFMGWNERGLSLLFTINKPLEKSFYPEITLGDSVELFISTKKREMSGMSPFCHHFFFLPEKVGEKSHGEILSARSSERNPPTNPDLIHTVTKPTKNGYQIFIYLPKEALFGFDPLRHNRISFTYRINRPRRPPQHFARVSDDFKFENKPGLWSDMELII